jgi:hypothetical protein
MFMYVSFLIRVIFLFFSFNYSTLCPKIAANVPAAWRSGVPKTVQRDDFDFPKTVSGDKRHCAKPLVSRRHLFVN